jgi:glycerophosphoryl diester phosphodiesterase
VVSSFNYVLLKQLHAGGIQLPLLLLVSLDRRQPLSQNLRNASICIAPYFLPKFLDGLAVHYMLARKTMIKILQPKGATVFVWTVDDPNQMRKFISWDVDGIITNDPQQLQALKSERNQEAGSSFLKP